MKVVDQARLGFREGKSDKVYEVDLVEVASGQFVVNFRYGRRGSALREGTKTPVPVPLDKARALFAALVAEKRKGGYSSAGGASAPPPRAPAADRVARLRAYLLRELALGKRSDVPLQRVIQRVGELGAKEAEPLLLELLASADSYGHIAQPDVFRFFVVGALCRTGSTVSVPKLRALLEGKKPPRYLRDATRLALVMLTGAEERVRQKGEVPAQFWPHAAREVNQVAGELEASLVSQPAAGRDTVFSLYLCAPARGGDASYDDEAQRARRLVLAAVRVARLTAPMKGLLRTLQWAAEIRRDAELFAVLGRRFEQERDGYPATTPYFQRRTARVLRRLASIESDDYVRFATALVLKYRDQDAKPVVLGAHVWPEFAPYHALNLVIYGQRKHYEPAHHRRATWRCVPMRRADQPLLEVRDEAYPWLWDRAPDALWRIGMSQAAFVVIRFAVLALREQTAYLAERADDALADAMISAHPAMRALAFDTARPRTPNLVLLRAALRSGLDAAEGWAFEHLREQSALLASEPGLLVLLALTTRADLRAAVDALAPALGEDARRSLVAQAVSQLVSLRPEQDADVRAQAVLRLVRRLAGDVLQGVAIDTARDLLAHPLSSVAEFGAEIVLRRSRVGTLEPGLLDALLESSHRAVRTLGARIVADTPLAVLKDEPSLLTHFALSAHAELRQETRSLFAAMAEEHPDVARSIALDLTAALRSTLPEGAPSHVVSLLRAELRGVLPRLDAEAVMSLLSALSPHAREAGGLLLPMLGPDELELDLIVRLARHEILSVRQGAWALCEGARDRFQLAPLALARLCDATWEDSRAFAFGFVKSFPDSTLVPDTVIAICDSVLPDVQRFGQELMHGLWREAHAERYLVRLAEHPSTNMQLMVSGLLESHARGKLVVLQKLLPYFATVLSMPNRGKVAKQRVLTFLRAEAVASEAAARLLAPLLDRQSATSAVSHKAPLIAALVAVHESYPAVPVPLVDHPPELRGTRGV